ncbi:flagellar hook-associated protein 3 FlgL [Sporomusaceae bacterium BoRhaA]|uniref:flagellar hook-associated protein FlgL n=1 Tax=Pelorhabdus rhamnosifermentans TaxID=2772457 RepID=UPI001C06189D|nr:flagellar hook-associated protein FlgL [Pelorhabdus rhamnosifermentans]MBU2699146.1 flagellar hook-associated protein 3 FlgL [Pelorhabdus rhamnosifermentans]
MRVTNDMFSNQFLTNYNDSLTNALNLNNQLSTGKAFTKPSEAPVKAVRALTFHTSGDVNDLYTQNVDDAISWMNTSDTAVSGIIKSVTQIRTLVNNAATGTNTPASKAAIAKQINALIDELVTAGNAQIGDRYVFAGQNDTVQPFTRNPSTGVVTYSGTYSTGANPTAGVISMQVSPGKADPLRDQVNLDGQQLFGTIDGSGQPQIFKDLLKIKNDVLTADSATISSDLGTIDTDFNTITNGQTSLGARQASYTNVKTALTTDSVTIAGATSDNENVDVGKTSIYLQQAMNVYNACLSVGAKVLPVSLVDYLK